MKQPKKKKEPTQWEKDIIEQMKAVNKHVDLILEYAKKNQEEAKALPQDIRDLLKVLLEVEKRDIDRKRSPDHPSPWYHWRIGNDIGLSCGKANNMLFLQVLEVRKQIQKLDEEEGKQ